MMSSPEVPRELAEPRGEPAPALGSAGRSEVLAGEADSVPGARSVPNPAGCAARRGTPGPGRDQAVMDARTADATRNSPTTPRKDRRNSVRPSAGDTGPALGSAIPKSTKTHRIAENFDVFDFPLSGDELQAIAASPPVSGGGPECSDDLLLLFGVSIPKPEATEKWPGSHAAPGQFRTVGPTCATASDLVLAQRNMTASHLRPISDPRKPHFTAPPQRASSLRRGPAVGV